MAKKKVTKTLINETVEIDALQVAALIRGEQIVVEGTLIVLTEVEHEIPTADILQVITEDMESAEFEEKESADGDLVEYNEDEDDQDEEE